MPNCLTKMVEINNSDAQMTTSGGFNDFKTTVIDISNL